LLLFVVTPPSNCAHGVEGVAGSNPAVPTTAPASAGAAVFQVPLIIHADLTGAWKIRAAAPRQRQAKEGIGSLRIRFPVAAKIALHTAGASAGRAASPTPPGSASLRTR